METLVIDWVKEEPKMGQIIRRIYVFMFTANNSILSRLYNIFFRKISNAEGVLPNDEFWKKKDFTVFKISVKMQIWWSNPYKMWFCGRSVTQIFFQEICSSGDKQTIHKLSAAFIVKTCHPRTSLKHKHIMSFLNGVLWRFQIYNLFCEVLNSREDISNNEFREIRNCFHKTVNSGSQNMRA